MSSFVHFTNSASSTGLDELPPVGINVRIKKPSNNAPTVIIIINFLYFNFIIFNLTFAIGQLYQFSTDLSIAFPIFLIVPDLRD